MYCGFGCKGNPEWSPSHVITFLLVAFVMGTSVEMHIISPVIITRKFLVKLIGEEFLLRFLPKNYKQLLKFFLPILCLTGWEVITSGLFYIYEISVQEASYKAYQGLYGFEAQEWPEEIKVQYLKKKLDNLSYHYGLMTYLAHKVNVESLFNIIITTVTDFLKNIK